MRKLTQKDIATSGSELISIIFSQRSKHLSNADMTWQPGTFPEIWLDKKAKRVPLVILIVFSLAV